MLGSDPQWPVSCSRQPLLQISRCGTPQPFDEFVERLRRSLFSQFVSFLCGPSRDIRCRNEVPTIVICYGDRIARVQNGLSAALTIGR